jgi:Ca-activated chloride channel family protein
VLADLLDTMPPRPLSLWSFSDRAWRVMPASEDLRLLKRLVFSLAPDLLPLSGRNLARALEEVAASQGGKGGILVITGSSDAAAEAVARTLRRKGCQILVLALAGSEENPLRQLAEAGGGVLFQAERLQPLAKALGPDTFMVKAQQGKPVPVDDGPWLILLLLPLALTLFRKAPGILVVLLFLSPPPVGADWKTWFSNSNQQAWQLFRAQRYPEAAERFEDPLWRGIAFYRAGNYRAAAASLSGIDSVLAHYNRGNALVQLGELEAARRAYERALALDPDFSDARYNLDLLDTPAATPLPAGCRGGHSVQLSHCHIYLCPFHEPGWIRVQQQAHRHW